MLGTGVDRSDGGVMVDRFGVHRFDQTDIIGNGGGVGNNFTEPSAILSMLGKFKHWSYAGEGGLLGSHPGDTLAITDTVGQFLAVVFPQLWMIIKHIDVGGTSGHKHVNHTLRGRFKVGTAQGAVQRD